MMELKELLDEASKLDGVCLQHQEIKVHSNGVKITLKKSYADDGLIDPSKSYTIVLIPEKEEKIITGVGEFSSAYWELDPFLDLLRKASYQALLGIAKDFKPFHYDVGLIPGNVSGSALRVTFSDKWDQRILDSSVNPVYAQRLLGLIGLKGEFYSRSMMDNDTFHRLITDSLKKGIPVLARMTKAKRELDLIVGYKGDQFLRMNRGNYIQSIVPQLIYVIDVANSNMLSPPGSNTDETSYA